jgi:hypothetical protein
VVDDKAKVLHGIEEGRAPSGPLCARHLSEVCQVSLIELADIPKDTLKNLQLRGESILAHANTGHD